VPNSKIEPHQIQETKNVIENRAAMRTTLLLVDDNIDQLELQSLVLTSSGFEVLTANCPVKAMSMIAQRNCEKIDIAVVDYHMPDMNGCALAEHLRKRHPALKIILYSAALEIPEDEMRSVDVFVSKSDGMARLLARLTELA
jgi:CheY-like chemotaxis protein